MSQSEKSTVNANTEDLIELLEVLLLTTAPKPDSTYMDCIHLQTIRSEFGDEPGERDVLVGVAYDGEGVVGSLAKEVTGTLDDPILLRGAAAKSLVVTFKALLKEEEVPEEHFVDLVVLEDDTTEDLSLSVSTYAAPGVDTRKTKQEHPVYPADAYPIRGLARALHGKGADTVDIEGDELESGALAMFDTNALARLSRVGKKMGDGVRMFRRHHPASWHQVEAGAWIGAALGVKYDVDVDVDEPYHDVYVPLPDEDEDEN